MAEHRERKALEQTQALVADTLLRVRDIINLLNMGTFAHVEDVAHVLQDKLQHKLDSTNEALEQCLLWEQDNE